MRRWRNTVGWLSIAFFFVVFCFLNVFCHYESKELASCVEFARVKVAPFCVGVGEMCFDEIRMATPRNLC